MNEIIILGAGCFWCVEAVFSSMLGVISVDVGYANGHTKNPTYNQVCSGDTGHAEVAKIIFDTKITNLEDILDLFFKSHDPTTLNKQGADKGTQYRSAIFYKTKEQGDIANKVLKRWEDSKFYNSSIVTEIEPLNTFYIAENYHQEYYINNRSAPYCKFVIKPKLDKLNN